MPVISRRVLASAAIGSTVAIAGLAGWWTGVDWRVLILVPAGGFLCGFLGGDTATAGLDIAMGRVLPAAMLAVLAWVVVSVLLLVEDPFAATAVAVILLPYVPLLFVPFAFASAAGGFLREKSKWDPGA